MKINLLNGSNHYKINTTELLLRPFTLTVIGCYVEKISNKKMDVLKQKLPHCLSNTCVSKTKQQQKGWQEKKLNCCEVLTLFGIW